MPGADADVSADARLRRCLGRSPTPFPAGSPRTRARLLFDEAAAAGPGARLLEIGSHQGRSTVCSARCAAAVGGEVIAIDPFVEGRLFGGSPTREQVPRQPRARPASRRSCAPVEEYSTEARPAGPRTFDLLYIDGKHDYWTFSDDLRWRALPAAAAPRSWSTTPSPRSA